MAKPFRVCFSKAWTHFAPVALAVIHLAGCASNKNSGLSTISEPSPDGPPAAVTQWTKVGLAQKPLADKPTHILIEIDGGGIMGVTPALILADLEKKLQHGSHPISKLRDAVSVFSGTSTGAIIAGMLDAGISAQKVAEYYKTKGVDLFNSKGRNPLPFPLCPLFEPTFNRAAFQDSIYDALGDAGLNERMTLGDLYEGPLLLIASYDLCSERTLWFRTKDPNNERLTYNGNVQLVDAISTSALSAALFFGKLPAPGVVWDQWQSDGSTRQVRGAMFNDGGQGTQNSTLAQTVLQCLIQGWGNRDSNDGQVIVISLGCGNDFATRQFAAASGLTTAGQAVAYIANEARPESLILQWRAATFIANSNPNFRVYRFDYIPAAGSSAFSAKMVKDYEAAAQTIIERPEYTQLVSDLCRLHHIVATPAGPAPRAAAPSSAKQSTSLKGI